MPFDSTDFIPPREDPEPKLREPMFKAPWPALALSAAILLTYALQSVFLSPQMVEVYAFSPAGFEAGRRITLLTALFLHGGWAHALMNAGAALAFGAPVARFFGVRPLGALSFLVFYLACGVLASLGFAAFHHAEAAPMVGASGAVSGLMGATSRLLAGRGRLGRIFSGPVLGMGGAWLAVNLLIALIGFAPGAGDAPVAWEAHIAGFVAGVLLFGPFAWAARRT